MKTPKNFPVKVLKTGEAGRDVCTCGTCGRSWDDAIATGYTPAPSGRCPFEEFHKPARAPIRRAEYRADGQELVGHDWDNGPQAWDVIRDRGDQWLCLADPNFSAQIVAALNAQVRA